MPNAEFVLGIALACDQACTIQVLISTRQVYRGQTKTEQTLTEVNEEMYNDLTESATEEKASKNSKFGAMALNDTEVKKKRRKN